MLADLVAYLISADTSGLSSDRQTAIAALRAAVGTRVYADILEEGQGLPALTYQLIDGGIGHVLAGTSDGIYHPRVQIDVYTDLASGGPAVRDSVAANVIAALDMLSGSIVGTSADLVIWDNEQNLFEPDRKQYRKMLDFRIFHN